MSVQVHGPYHAESGRLLTYNVVCSCGSSVTVHCYVDVLDFLDAHVVHGITEAS